MSISTSIPKAAGQRRSRLVTTIVAIAAVLALAAWGVATYAIGSGARPVRSNAPTQASVLRGLTSAGREYVLGIASMTPAQVSAAFGINPASVQGRASGSGPRPVRSGAPTLAVVLRSLPPRERRYVLGIASLTPLQLWAAFGTSPTPPVLHGGGGGSRGAGATKSPSLALPILPACGPGPCWRGTTSTGPQR